MTRDENSDTARLQYLDPKIIARLGSLELKARSIVEGFLSGLHRSPFKGFSVEFAEYRQYLPGDSLSTIDWKVYARTDRFYVKKYQEETNLDCHILLDVSASMGYGSQGVTKMEYGAYLAASLAYLMHRQRDAVGLMAFDDRIVNFLRASSRPGHLRTVLVALDRLRPGQGTNAAKPLHHLAETLSKRGLVILISDLLDEPEGVLSGLKHIRFQGTEVVVFHVLDPDELTFPFEQAARFRDLETGEEVLAIPPMIRDHYLSEVERHVNWFERELRQNNIDYCRLETSKPLEFALLAYLATRKRRL